ncbi:Helicase conserved C-terminal domain protein [Synechococcus sp. PCC 7335]|uniref:DISARM system SNF2-like helicase DrmD n=1 Tax=Synechococcus sp. (strain ATCC 29403 / PCC 7335) TaxID=91464 RepID=UPI00017EE116|nr:DISARM system SNF2-like helicase DrmD [Synechococcus sp. PCC 7335]EDX83168.1 Helicase conserved C-terminal domain protein [Synechococcus sp. PCC 7335]
MANAASERLKDTLTTGLTKANSSVPGQLAPGQLARVRSRQYLIEEVIVPTDEKGDTLVRLSCVEDDAQGEPLEVFWEREIDAKLIGAATWDAVVSQGFDNPRYFSAYFHTLRWNCVTSTDPRLFQAPYRAGIEVNAYQLEPLRKALRMPRVNLFIADDVGLGKTIEAGLILREMLLRQKIKRVVISAPPSVVQQWKEEMESRFGLTFTIYDRAYVARMRRSRGYAINPWTTHNRFIISHALLRNETYAAPLRDWLGEFSAGSMFILDEAHNAAPASSSKYAVDSQLTKTVRNLAPRFEHRLFLSATPHNGHSNSFAALLEILDPQRFCRGVPVRSKALLDAVMVRRLKQDLREIKNGDFPERQVIALRVDGLPEEAPELVLSQLLQQYRDCREERLREATKSSRAAAMLVITSLQKRLLSSIEAFSRTLSVHCKSVEKLAKETAGVSDRLLNGMSLSLLEEAPGNDDERADLDEAEVALEEDNQMVIATQASMATSGPNSGQTSGGGVTARELELLEQMSDIAAKARYLPDGRIEQLAVWLNENLCPQLGEKGAQWNNHRVLIFTEYTDTKRYLEQQLGAIIAESDRAQKRIETFHGGIGDERREQVKAAFNADPAAHPLRILIATDAAREGVNLQNYCANLFHFDVPWNPSRMEQRNGRIDRKLQKADLVRCYYFVYSQRAEDRVLDVLVQKTKRIQEELGSLSPVVEKNVSKLLKQGIRTSEEAALTKAIDESDTADSESVEKGKVISEELEAIRDKRQALLDQEKQLQNILDASYKWLGFEDRHFRDAISASLELLGARSLTPLSEKEARENPDQAQWEILALDEKLGTDPTWAATLDTLRSPRKRGQKLWEWRNESPILPVIFRDSGSLDSQSVHLHLEQRLVQRLLGRFLSQGFVHDDLTRACVCLTDTAIPRVIMLGRLSLYGQGAARLHDEIVPVVARWKDPDDREGLQVLGDRTTREVLQTLEDSLANPRLREVPELVRQRLQASAPQDVADLSEHLDELVQRLIEAAEAKLAERGAREAKEMKTLLEAQRDRISRRQRETDRDATQLTFDFAVAEKRQLDADRRHWEHRLKMLEAEIETEPARIEAGYRVKVSRIEPVGLVYLWPVTG